MLGISMHAWLYWKNAASDKGRAPVPSYSVKIRTLLDAYDLLCLHTLIMCVSVRARAHLYPPCLPRSRSVTTQPGQNNMDTTVAEWPFWVKALRNNKQLLAARSCFPAAHRCQNTELTAIPFTAVEKHQPSKPTYLQRLWTACNPSAARRLSETRQLRAAAKEITAQL